MDEFIARPGSGLRRKNERSRSGHDSVKVFGVQLNLLKSLLSTTRTSKEVTIGRLVAIVGLLDESKSVTGAPKYANTYLGQHEAHVDDLLRVGGCEMDRSVPKVDEHLWPRHRERPVH